MATIRRVHNSPFELTDRRRVSFYAAVYNSPAVVFDYGPDHKTRIKYREVIPQGAFAKALTSSPEIVADIDHDESRTFARTSDGSLMIQSDPHGLYCTCWVPETAEGDAILRDIKDGKLTGCSFHALYTPEAQVWRTGGDMPECTVTEMYQLVDVCLTGNPAYEDTDVLVRTKTINKGKAQAELFRFRKLYQG